MNDAPVPDSMAAGLIQPVNPVLDVVNDLGLGGFFTISEVEVDSQCVTVRGRLTIPEAPDNVPIPTK